MGSVNDLYMGALADAGFSSGSLRDREKAFLESAAGGSAELYGNGMPEGVVTATVGTIYTDVDATNGAIRWYKVSGSGNTGWKVIYGDTGWVEATNYYTNCSAAPSEGGTQVRRFNDLLYVTFAIAIAAPYVSGDPVVDLPDWAYPYTSYAPSGYGGINWYLTFAGSTPTIRISASGASAARRSGSAVFPLASAVDPWPTVL